MKKILSILLVIISLFTCFACTPSEEPQTEDGKTSKGVQMLNDYENIYDLNTMLFSGVLGKVDLNDDLNFVKTGKKSAKVTVESNPYKTGAPKLFQSFEMPKHELDFTDFSKTLALKLAVYNAQQSVIPFSLQLTYEVGAAARKWYELQPGWNDLTLNVSREYIPEYTDSEGNEEIRVTGVNLGFDRPEKTEQDTVFYLDNLRIYFTEKPFSPIVMSLEDNEIASFDEQWQIELLDIEARDYMTPQVYMDSSIKSGTGSSLRIDTAPGQGNWQVTERWCGVSINKDQLSLVHWDEYGSDAMLCFDIYAPKENGVPNLWLSMYVDGVRYFSGDMIETVKGSWITVRYPVSQLNGTWEYIEGVRDFAHTTGLVIRWGEYVGEPQTVYIDNIRMEN